MDAGWIRTLFGGARALEGSATRILDARAALTSRIDDFVFIAGKESVRESFASQVWTRIGEPFMARSARKVVGAADSLPDPHAAMVREAGERMTDSLRELRGVGWNREAFANWREGFVRLERQLDGSILDAVQRNARIA